ncbi:hypothetical protein ES705_27762 [subsurface metagenome]
MKIIIANNEIKSLSTQVKWVQFTLKLRQKQVIMLMIVFLS